MSNDPARSETKFTEAQVRDMMFSEEAAPARLILAMLGSSPVSSKGWPPYSQLTVSHLLHTVVTLPSSEPMAAMHIAAMHVMKALDVSLNLMAAQSSPFGTFDDENDKARYQRESQEYKDKWESSSEVCLNVAMENLLPIKACTVDEVLFRKSQSDGFYKGIFKGSLESIKNEQLPDAFGRHDRSADKWLAFRSPFKPGLSVSMVRMKQGYDEPVGTLHNVEAFVHDDNDELVARISMALSCVKDWVGLGDFVMHLDGANRTDLLEVASAVVNAVESGQIEDDSWSRLLFVTDWEVRQQDRGKGLGLELLKLVISTAFKGLPKPRCLAARVEPAQFVLPALYGSPMEEREEFMKPTASLKRYWYGNVVPAVSRTIEDAIEVRYHPLLHHGMGEEMVLGELLMRAEDLD